MGVRDIHARGRIKGERIAMSKCSHLSNRRGCACSFLYSGAAGCVVNGKC
jgi:hypothetical protein